MTCRAAKPSGGAKAFDFDIAFDNSGSSGGGTSNDSTATTGGGAVGLGMERYPGSTTTTSDLFLAPEKAPSSFSLTNVGGSSSTPRGLVGKVGLMRKDDSDDVGGGGGGFYYASAKLGDSLAD